MIKLIANSGIQYYELPQELVVSVGMNDKVMKALRYKEAIVGNKLVVEPAYYFPNKGQFLLRVDLQSAGYLDPVKNDLADESNIQNHMNWLDEDDLVSISRLETAVGHNKRNALSIIENKWLPVPFFRKESKNYDNIPTSWCRIKLIPVPEKTTKAQKVYRVLMAFDTNTNTGDVNTAPCFAGENYLDFSMCGISVDDISSMNKEERKKMEEIVLPLIVYDFCSTKKNPILDLYLQEVFDSTDLATINGAKSKYIIYYIYLMCYLHVKQWKNDSGDNVFSIPDVRLYNDEINEHIHTNLILDIGNSRTFGLVAEEPLENSFSNASIIELTDLETGDVYSEPFDMRLCFKEENFGLTSDGFKWPSLVRLGKEAARNIYNGEQDLLDNMQFETSYSSPKRFLWDTKPHNTQWRFVSEKDRTAGYQRNLTFEGLVQQFKDDGSFTDNPKDFGTRSVYSRSSLMTFCFIEILLHVNMQINSVKFRNKNGNDNYKRDIKRIIITCPTAMTRAEQKKLRQCMEEATVVLKRYYSGTYTEPYVKDSDNNSIHIIPSVSDLSKTVENLESRHSWNYDEATCSQMVYMYSEMRRYLGNSTEFFRSYGKCRNGEASPSITVASLDIGAGTTDIMICNYTNDSTCITPKPLFWESYQIAGNDLMKRIIIDVILDSPKEEYPNASGIITAKLRSMGCPNVADKMHHFFSDTHQMGVVERRMRKEFMIQVLMPTANHLLDLLHKKEPECSVGFNDIFINNKPAESLLRFFEAKMGFKYEELVIGYSPRYLNEIIRKVFEPNMRKWAALFYAYKCDIVLIAGRPCSLDQVHKLLRRLLPVAPNRLISMNDYHVGSWYPGSSNMGDFRDNKSIVAVGALISYLAEQGKLGQFRLNTELLKCKILPTTDYIGIINPDPEPGVIESNFFTPESNSTSLEVSALPLPIGSKQLDVPGYPATMLYMLQFNEREIRKEAISRVKSQVGLPSSAEDSDADPDKVQNEMEEIKLRLRNNTPWEFQLTRDYYEDKEKIIIESVNGDMPRKMFELALQTCNEDSANWLDTGIFKMHRDNR